MSVDTDAAEVKLAFEMADGLEDAFGISRSSSEVVEAGTDASNMHNIRVKLSRNITPSQAEFEHVQALQREIGEETAALQRKAASTKGPAQFARPTYEQVVQAEKVATAKRYAKGAVIAGTGAFAVKKMDDNTAKITHADGSFVEPGSID